MRGPSKRGATLGPLGDKILFENEYVRIWSVKLDPGERQAWHKHDLPYVIVPMTDGKIEIESVDGKIVRPDDKSGKAIWRDPGEIHDLRNLGDAVYKNVLVEIKPQAK